MTADSGAHLKSRRNLHSEGASARCSSRFRQTRFSPHPVFLVVFFVLPLAASAGEPTRALDVRQVAAKIDGFMESHWSVHKLQPAELSDDATFLRRITLDLNGRIPTTRELDQFLGDQAKDKRAKVISRLVDGPEFSLHWGNVLDEMIQTRHAGNADFVDYLRRSLRDRKSWDAVFRELMLGPWDTDERKPANRFLDRRAGTTDVLTVDATRVFFGVDISCAKCHDHPLVEDWTQNHFYGMSSFFNRTTGGKGKIGEKAEGDVKFLAADGNEKIAEVMFLTGQVVPAVAASEAADADRKSADKPASRRELLVRVALEERNFFSRSLVNRLWENLFGRGLVHPVDQMHSQNAPAVPGLLEWLGEDFAENGYDLRRLITAIVSSRAYQLGSTWPHESNIPEATHFAVASLRPLDRRQFSFSLLMATGNAELSEPDAIQSRVERYVSIPGIQRIGQYLTVENDAAKLSASLDPRTSDFHSSAIEALFMSNNPATQQLVSPDSGNLASQLEKISDTQALVKTAVRTVLSREPREQELTQLVDWFERQKSDRSATAGQLIWVLVTAAEFRFNH